MTRALAPVIVIVIFLAAFELRTGAAFAGESAGSPAVQAAQSYPQPTPRPPVITTPPAVMPLKLMSPFPIVRIAGRVTRRGARIRILSVRAPAGTGVLVRCRRQRCGRRSLQPAQGIDRPVRFRRFERNFRVGTVIEVLVGRPDLIGKFTSFRIRRNRRPIRRDLCLLPGALRGASCPEE